MLVGEWFNGKTAAFKVADLGSNPCSPPNVVWFVVYNLLQGYSSVVVRRIMINIVTVTA